MTLDRKFLLLLSCAFLGCAAYAQTTDLHWAFARSENAAAVDSASGVKAKLGGEYDYVPGVRGDGLRFDGYTTSMTVPVHEGEARGRDGFTLEAWVALNTYPWNWVPIVDQEVDRQEGYFFGIDAMGHVGLGASINGQWQMVVSTEKLPLKKWAHVAGTYATSGGDGKLTIFLDGKPVGQLPVHGVLTTARADILIGRVREAVLPFPEAVVKPQYPIWYSLDGILDELSIEEHAETPAEIASDYAAVQPPAGEVLPWPKMPSGCPGAGRFGAFYATLRYQDTWDRLRRIGPDSDVVVRFDESPIRLVFWQGTNYIPAWVTENDKWYTDEFVETWGDDACAPGWDCEPMSDKQSRYSHVNIVESNDARAVVHWRYADAEVEQLNGAFPDPLTGWFHWIDEYWTVYPDGIAIRKQVLHEGDVSRPHEWQETIILHQPGMRPEDDINWDALTFENMQGETKTYTWRPKTTGEFSPATGPAGFSGPDHPNMQLVNLKSEWKPFQITTGQDAGADIYGNEDTYSAFECWNHWPVAQIASSDRPCVVADRASHSSLSHLYWKLYSSEPNAETKILMDGLTTKTPAGLLALAKSWLHAPVQELEGSSYRSDGYDETQRAYVLARTGSAAAPLQLTLAASEESPLFDPALVIHGWGDGGAQLKLDGKPVAWGKSNRMGHVEHLDGTDLVIWIEKQTTQPLRVEVIPGR
ncbi:MAG: LamG domain-containing protein [Acidobacteriaceae bacterium]